MSNYLPDGCTQAALDRHLNGDDELEYYNRYDEDVIDSEHDLAWWDEEEHSERFQDVDDRANHLANRKMDGSTDRVASPVASIPDGLGFE